MTQGSVCYTSDALPINLYRYLNRA